jgi:hypothetical protein
VHFQHQTEQLQAFEFCTLPDTAFGTLGWRWSCGYHIFSRNILLPKLPLAKSCLINYTGGRNNASLAAAARVKTGTKYLPLPSYRTKLFLQSSALAAQCSLFEMESALTAGQCSVTAAGQYFGF